MERRVRRWRENRGGVGQDLLGEVNSLGKLPQGFPDAVSPAGKLQFSTDTWMASQQLDFQST